MKKSIMRGILCMLGMILLAGGVFAQPLGECYHTREELYQFIFDLQAANPTFVRVDSIGHSRGDQLAQQYPLYAVKISDNVDDFEDEPTVLIIAHIHAEEVAGMEATIRFMQRLVAPPLNQEPFRTLRNQTQIYVIPTMNPDGLEVISRGWDNTWRKNGYRPPEYTGDSCNIWPGSGWDSCGVDLNRNFDLNWIYGDSIWVRGSEEPFDYYRGPGPFSEPEARAVRDFARQIKPTTSIVWHSSRSGRVADRCIVAWQWGPDGAAKFSPDSAAIHRVMQGYISKTARYESDVIGPYLDVFGATRNGDLQDWFYRDLGTIQILTETSPNTTVIQPPCDSTNHPNYYGLTNSLLPPMQWLCRRVINYPVSGDMDNQGAPLKIYTRNSATSEPISAEWRILNTWSPILNPWYTNEEFGRATFLPPAGQVTVLARKEGYRNDTTTVTINPGDLPTSAILELDPLPWYNLTINVVNESSQAVPAKIYFDNGFPQTYDVNSPLQLSKPQGTCHLRIEPQQVNQVARWVHFYLDRDTSFTFTLPSGNTLFSEDFEDGLGDWTAGGTGGEWRQDVDTTSLNFGMVVYTNGEGYRSQYGSNWNTTFTLNQTLDLTGGNAYHLVFDRRGRLDMPADSFFMEVSVNNSDWQVVRGFSDLQVPWTRSYCDLSGWAGNNVYIRFRLQTDALLGDLGIHFDNVEVVGGVDLASPERPSPFPTEYRMTKIYPNPFNPATTIAYDAPGSGPIQFAIHNLLGQLVWSSTEAPPAPGRYELRWNGTSNGGAQLTSGIYFVRMTAKGNFYGTQKLMFLK